MWRASELSNQGVRRSRRSRFRRVVPHVVDEIASEGKHLRHLLLHSKPVHIFILLLLIADGMICLTCGVLEAHYLHGKSDDCIDWVNKCLVHHRRLGYWPEVEVPSWIDSWISSSWLGSFETAEALAYEDSLLDSDVSDALVPRMLAGSHSSSTSSSTSSHSSSTANSECAGHPHFGDHTLHDIEVALAYTSIAILGVFLLEQLLLIWDLGSDYLKPMFVLDFVVILSSLIIEILVVNMTIGGLLILARTWRFARVGHGVFEAKEMIKEMIGDDDDTIEKMKEAWSQLTPERWETILNSGTAESLKDSVTEDETKLARSLGNNAAEAMRVLAFARGWKQKLDKKAAKLAARGEAALSDPHRQHTSHSIAHREPTAQSVGHTG